MYTHPFLAIRRVSVDTFQRLLNMDLAWHLGRRIGALSKTMDRGGKSIDFLMRSMVFRIVPTSLEICLVSGIMANKFGPQYAGVGKVDLVWD